MLETGRTSTSLCKPPNTSKKMGIAFQTVTKHGEASPDIRGQFIADPGHILIESDQKGAEAQVVAILARDDRMKKMFDYDVDVHRVTYAWVMNLGQADSLLNEFFTTNCALRANNLAYDINTVLKNLINKEDRQLGKKFRHAANYDMGKGVAAVLAAVSELKAGKILNRVHQTNPNIRAVFHAEIQEALRSNDRKLMNPFGRERQFFNRWGHQMFKEAYAQLPQSTVSDQTKYAGTRIEQRAVMPISKKSYLKTVLESHDSLTHMCPKEMLSEALPIIKEEMEKPIDFAQCTLSRGILIIPCEQSIGENWLHMKEIK